MGLLRHKMSAPERVYTLTIPVVTVFALIDGLNAAGFLPEAFTSQLGQWLPLFQQGLGWITPFALIFAVAWLTSQKVQHMAAKSI